MRKKLTDRTVVVNLPGGPLTVEWRDDNHVWMTGPVATDFSGVIDPDTFAWHKSELQGAA
jgi:diaminopimelate epimerase